MTTIRRFGPLVSALAMVCLPRLAQAEVSVLLDQEGNLRRLLYLTTGSEHHRVIWRQMRPSIPREVMLNPDGDVLGDGAPVIRYHPLTGHPWVVWSMNVAGQKVIGAAVWDSKAWTVPRRVVTVPDPYYYDQLDPALAFDETGRPFLVWTRNAQMPEIYFSTLLRGVWTPPLRVSDAGIGAWSPAVTVSVSSAVISYETEAGTVTKSFETSVLLQSAANLMDTPIPPGQLPDPGIPGAPSGGDRPPLFNKR